MPLTQEELDDFSHRVTHASRPIVFYDDDADGLASYFLVLRANPDAIGIRAGRGPELDTEFARKVEENGADLVLILDKPRVDPEFFSQVQTPTIWLDHHDLDIQHPENWTVQNLTYINPLLHGDDHESVSYWVYKALGGPLWIAAVGTTADWHESLLAEFSKKYPSLAPKELEIKEALYRSRLGEIIRMFNFAMKGAHKHTRKVISALSKIDDPTELLASQTAKSRLIWKHYRPLLQDYLQQLSEAKAVETKEETYVHVFSQLRNSFVADVANELLLSKDAKIILVGREVSDDVKFSMRSHKVDLRPIIEQALQNAEGYGGGHAEACGGSIAKRDWGEFVKLIRTSS